ncbi:AAA family ATPase [Paenibacillus mesotrionivorans]|uniref:AAA family ATPase n=1 Tax=Paenibacillus mesotrionivorans TaxID=3160968 RepID=A0ACC7P6T1_9BACL
METKFAKDMLTMMQLKANLEACILGKAAEIELLLTAVLAGGHVLLEDVPGTGKTVLIKALARSVKGEFRRIQCNPDLLPTDITGVSIYHPKLEAFVFRQGPVFTHILLVDEINRASTKTQSALFEAMEEHHVTVDGESHELPEAQLDRFMLKLSLGYPDREAEKMILSTHTTNHPVSRLEPVLDMEGLQDIQKRVSQIYVDEAIADYVVDLSRETREHTAVFLGASPRATIALLQAAKALAYLRSRTYVTPDDVKYLVPYVFGHRLILQPEARMDGGALDALFQSIFQRVPVPVRVER